MADKVFSYKTRKALVQTGAQFANYIKRNYPQIKYIKDIQSEHVEAFLKDAICRGCSNITVQQYKTRLDKLALLAERKYHTPVRYMEHVKIKWKENIKTYSAWTLPECGLILVAHRQPFRRAFQYDFFSCFIDSINVCSIDQNTFMALHNFRIINQL